MGFIISIILTFPVVDLLSCFDSFKHTIFSDKLEYNGLMVEELKESDAVTKRIIKFNRGSNVKGLKTKDSNIDSTHLYLDYYVGMPLYEFHKENSIFYTDKYDYKKYDSITISRNYPILGNLHFRARGFFYKKKLIGVDLEPYEYIVSDNKTITSSFFAYDMPSNLLAESSEETPDENNAEEVFAGLLKRMKTKFGNPNMLAKNKAFWKFNGKCILIETYRKKDESSTSYLYDNEKRYVMRTHLSIYNPYLMAKNIANLNMRISELERKRLDEERRANEKIEKEYKEHQEQLYRDSMEQVRKDNNAKRELDKVKNDF